MNNERDTEVKNGSFFVQSASTFATQIVLMVISIVGGVIVARVLGPELKGKATLIELLAQTVFMVCSLGLGAAFSYSIARANDGRSQIISAAIVIGTFLWCVGMVFFWFSWELHRSIWIGIETKFLVAASLLSLCYILTNYGSRILIGLGRIDQVNVGALAKSLVNISVIVFAVWLFDFGLAGLVIALLVSSVVHIMSVGWFLRDNLRFESFWSADFISRTAAYGLKSYALLLINFLNYRLDLILLKYFDGDQAVGIYSLAVGMAELMWLAPNAAVAPLFSSVAKSDADNRSERTLQTTRFSLFLLLILSSLAVVVGPYAINLLYGKEFEGSYFAFVSLLPGVCLFPIFKLLTVDLAARGRPGIGTIASALALVINIIANCYLIPKFGFVGAALATSLSYICMSAVVLAYFVRLNDYKLAEILFVNKSDLSKMLEFSRDCSNRFCDFMRSDR
ncbi:Polysaccharide biosynthesis protein [Rubripirellula obstinata]|uniref:Polysaccharide biosynthesis protein n=1 Tax=Rubripirellula obstinata TaxID=406547 RepID=A0A5B1CKZ3_9BACT|nr:polysaccharide biosynthesis C-terminal domain-containing protein [Rubripirellula obstinata]KAA1261002.1 Polysaccharide biosynthesis protein [Rubripirellula obstinata]